MKPIILFYFFLFTTSLFGQQGPFGPGTATTSGSTSYNWTNATGAITDNSSSATAVINGKKNTSNLLRLTNFGFNIPIGSTINGIMVEIRMQGTNGPCVDQTIQLRKASSALSSNKARATSDWPKKNASYVQFGGSTDLWGTTWLISDINSSSFGIDIAAKAKKNTTTARVEYVRITIYYNQANFYSKSTGNLNLLSSWGTNTDGSGTAPSNFTNNNQTFYLRNRSSATLTANFAISGTSSKLVVGNGINNISFTVPSTFTYLGVLDVSNNATVSLNNTTVPTIGQIASVSNGGTSTITYGATGNQNITGRNYDHLIISGTGIKTLLGNARSEKTLTISSGVTLSDGGFVFTAEDNIVNSGTHISLANGSLNLEGSVTQSISGSNGVFGNLEIINDDDVTLSNSIAINGNLLLEEGALSIGSNTLTLNGNVSSISGSLTGGNNSNILIGGKGNLGTLIFTPGSEVLNNLTINRSVSGIVEIGTDLDVRNTFTMTAGDIYTGSNSFTLGYSTASRGTLAYTSGSIIGSFTRWFNNATNTGNTGFFPIGTLSGYRPVTIEFTSAPTTGGKLTAQFIDGYPKDLGLPLNESSNEINMVSESGIWQLTPTTLSGGSYTGTFGRNNFKAEGEYINLHLLKRANSTSSWTLHGTHNTTTGSNLEPILQRNDMTIFGEFGIGFHEITDLLPINLMFFRGEKNADRVLLHWATASEVNNDYFELERSDDAVNWISVAQINGNGNSDERIDYYYSTAKSIVSSYFRLKQVDYDGQFEFHNVIFVEGDDIIPMHRILVYPNPISVGDLLTIEPQNNYEEITNVTLNNMTNGVISNLKEQANQKYQIPNVPNQTYLITVETSERFYFQKIIVK